MRWILAASLAASSVAAAAPDTSTPAELLLCVRPAKGTALPPVLDGAPRPEYVERVEPGRPFDVPGLRVVISAPRHGPARIAARLVPEADRDGESADTAVDEPIGDAPVRLAGFVVVALPLDDDPRFEVLVEDLGCRERAQERPLRKGESRLVWLSTGAVPSYALRDEPWYEGITEGALQLELRTGLAQVPDADPAQPRAGYIALEVSDRVGGEVDSVTVPYAHLVTRRTVVRRQYKLEVVRTVLGEATSDVDGWPHAAGGPPEVSVLVRVTRR